MRAALELKGPEMAHKAWTMGAVLAALMAIEALSVPPRPAAAFAGSSDFTGV
jgi:hypothetical protein